METSTLRTSQDITTYIYICIWWWSIEITLFLWTQSYQSTVETPALRTSQDITTYKYIYIYKKIYIYKNIYIYIEMISWHHSLYLNTKLPISCGEPHLEHPKTFHIYILSSIDITIFIWTKNCQSAVETPALTTSQDIITHICIYKFL